MGNDTDKGAAMAGDGTAGGKRWGLRWKTIRTHWIADRSTYVEPWVNNAEDERKDFRKPLHAADWLTRADFSDRGYKESDFEVADIDTGESIPPDDPRIKSPTVDSGPSEPEPEPAAHQWKVGDKARVKADVLIDEWRSWHDLGSKCRKQFTLPAGSIIEITSVHGKSIAFRMEGRAGVMGIGPDDIEKIDEPEPVAHQWKVGDRARIKDDVNVDARTWGWWHPGGIETLVLPPGEELEVVDPSPNLVGVRSAKYDRELTILADRLEPIPAESPEPAMPEPSPAFRPGDRVKIVSGYASNVTAKIVSCGPLGWTIELPSGVHAYALSSQIERIDDGSAESESPSMDNVRAAEALRQTFDDMAAVPDDDDDDTSAHLMSHDARLSILKVAMGTVSVGSEIALECIEEGRIGEAWAEYHRIAGAMGVVEGILEVDDQ